MKSLVKICLTTAALTIVSLGLYTLTISLRGLSPLDLSNGARQRLLIDLILISQTIIFVVLAFILWRKAELSERAEDFLAQRLEISWLADLLIFIAFTAISGVIIALLDIWILNGSQFQLVLMRYSPLLFLMVAFPALILSSNFFIPARPRMISILRTTAILIALGILIQVFLIGQLAEPASTSFLAVVAVSFGMAISALALAFLINSSPKEEQELLILIVGLTIGLLLIQCEVWPRKLRAALPALVIFSPLIFFGLPLLSVGILSGWEQLKQFTSARIVPLAKALIVCGLLFLAYFYIRADLQHARLINTSASFSDEGAYMNMIKEARRLNFRYTGDQNRMPGYVFLQAVFYKPGISDTALFERGKLVNILLSVVLLGLLYLLFLQYFPFFQATLLLLIVAFSLFIYKSPYIQSEITFYFLSFVGFVLFLQMLLRPTWSLGLATGLVTGLAYLTKASTLLGIYIFVSVYILKEILMGIENFKHKNRQGLRLQLNRLLCLGLVLATFAGVIYPYAHALKQRFGHYFYNVNTTFLMWLDDWDQAVDFQNRYQVSQNWPVGLTQDQLPSLRNYLLTHTYPQIFERIWVGVLSEWVNIRGQFGILNSQLAYLWIFLIAVFANLRNSTQTMKKYPFIALFAVLYFGVYLASFAWYTPISSGRRFTYGLYIPFMFSILAALNGLVRNQIHTVEEGGNGIRLSRYFDLSNLIIALLLAFEIWMALTLLLFFDRFGS